MSEKLNLTSVADSVRKLWKDKDPELAKSVGVGSNLSNPMEGDFIRMPEWWLQMSNTPGIPFGRMVMLAGDSDSGKTSAAIMAMKAAQEQGCVVIYVETENKTTLEDLKTWGVDAEAVLLVKQTIAERAFQLMFDTWDAARKAYPTHKLFVVFDSIGNTISDRDAEIDLTDQKQKPGGKGQINRLGLNKMVAKMEQDKAAVMVINYTYDNIGSPGKTNAGGKAVNFFSSLTYQTMRKQWLEKTVKGQKVRIGAEVIWKLFKNHINKQNPGLKEAIFRITAEGMKLVDKSVPQDKSDVNTETE